METRVLKENDLFFLTNKEGNIPASESKLGLYTRDTRFLSTYELSIDGMELSLLSSEAERNFVGNIRLTNKEVKHGGRVEIFRETIGIKRKRFLYNGALYERISVENYNRELVSINLNIGIDVDFRDMFEIRGIQKGKKGKYLLPKLEDRAITFQYEGSDNVNRNTVVTFNRKVNHVNGKVVIPIDIAGGDTVKVVLTVVSAINKEVPEIFLFEEAYEKIIGKCENWLSTSTKVTTDSPVFNKLYARSLRDIHSLLTDLGDGPFPVAGIPWFAVPFGRDSLIAALQMLSINTEVAKSTLRILAKYQGTKNDPWRDEQPGKILHEIRFGELANNNEIPHTPYYGSIDSTPLFLVLAAEYYNWTGDLEFIQEILPNIYRALDWVEEYGDLDNDGFIEYFKESSNGIDNQAWKDSFDSVVHIDGKLAKAPIAIAEVQGYVYDAKHKLAKVFAKLGKHEYAKKLEQEAKQLKENFAHKFWMEKESFVAIALDEKKHQVESITTNPGHCLWSGLLIKEQASKVVQRLIADDMFSGFGIRTMSTQSARYNPMSYHDGSVWPHDNSIVFLGMKKQGFHQESMKVVEGLIQASTHFEYYRLPELFCGFARKEEYRPIPYPVACSPQAWAACTSFMMVQAILGITANVSEGIIKFEPSLPPSINTVEIQNLKVGKGVIDLKIVRDDSDNISLSIMKNTTGIQVNVPSQMLPST